MRHITLFFFSLLTASIFGQTEKSISVFFDFNSSQLSEVQKEVIDDLKESLQSGRFDLLSVEAFSDTIGSSVYNSKLAQRRGVSVMAYLNIVGTTVQPTSFGENYLVSESYTHQHNRRVDIHYRMNNSVPDIEEIIPAPSQIVSKFTEFIGDSTVTETMIELSILFVPGKALVLPESTHELWDLLQFMTENKQINAFIRGHVCCMDDMSLSIERASTVYDFLNDRSISSDRLKMEGFSNSMPVVSPELTDEDRKKNRRVDIIFTKVK